MLPKYFITIRFFTLFQQENLKDKVHTVDASMQLLKLFLSSKSLIFFSISLHQLICLAFDIQ